MRVRSDSGDEKDIEGILTAPADDARRISLPTPSSAESKSKSDDLYADYTTQELELLCALNLGDVNQEEFLYQVAKEKAKALLSFARDISAKKEISNNLSSAIDDFIVTVPDFRMSTIERIIREAAIDTGTDELTTEQAIAVALGIPIVKFAKSKQPTPSRPVPPPLAPAPESSRLTPMPSAAAARSALLYDPDDKDEKDEKDAKHVDAGPDECKIVLLLDQQRKQQKDSLITVPAAAIELQKQAARELSTRFVDGFAKNEDAPRDLWKAAKFAKKGARKDKVTDVGNVAVPKRWTLEYFKLWFQSYRRHSTISVSALGWWTSARLFVLRTHRMFDVSGGPSSPLLKTITQYGGLSYALEIVAELAAAFAAARRDSQTSSQSFLALFWQYLKKDDRPKRILNAVIWFACNITLIVATGGMSLLAQNIIGLIPFVADVFVDGHSGWKSGLREHEDLLKKVNDQLLKLGKKIIRTLDPEEREKLEKKRNELVLNRIKIEQKISALRSDRNYNIAMTLLIVTGMTLFFFFPPAAIVGAALALAFGSIFYGFGRRVKNKVMGFSNDSDIELTQIKQNIEATERLTVENAPLLKNAAGEAKTEGMVVSDSNALEPATATMPSFDMLRATTSTAAAPPPSSDQLKTSRPDLTAASTTTSTSSAAAAPSTDMLQINGSTAVAVASAPVPTTTSTTAAAPTASTSSAAAPAAPGVTAIPVPPIPTTSTTAAASTTTSTSSAAASVQTPAVPGVTAMPVPPVSTALTAAAASTTSTPSAAAPAAPFQSSARQTSSSSLRPRRSSVGSATDITVRAALTAALPFASVAREKSNSSQQRPPSRMAINVIPPPGAAASASSGIVGGVSSARTIEQIRRLNLFREEPEGVSTVSTSAPASHLSSKLLLDDSCRASVARPSSPRLSAAVDSGPVPV